MKKLFVLLFLLLWTITAGCQSIRYEVVYKGKKMFVPRYEGETIEIQVYDREEEKIVPIRDFQFIFQPPHWGEIRPIPQKTKTGLLVVKRIYSIPLSTEVPQYSIRPVPQKRQNKKNKKKVQKRKTRVMYGKTEKSKP
ncbi:MAG: hypothetical protein D6785_06860 [Planctomycetota bacterium]|nr:MAG: hypothetical protein D6785_06860 [Planctomycetota bacterium]